MFGKKVTILVVPEGTNKKVRRITIPGTLPFLLILLVGAAVGGVAALSLDTLEAWSRPDRPVFQGHEIAALRTKTVRQNVQIHAFADKIRLLEDQMAKLRQFDLKLRAMTRDNPLIKDKALKAVGGSDSADTGPRGELKAGSRELVRRMHRDLDRLLAEAGVCETRQHELGRLFQDTRSIMASTPDAWPLKGPVTSYFGYRPSPFGGRSEFHRGLDIGAPNGTPIVAPADGVVVDVDWNSGYGKILIINHGYGVVTRYAHISQSYVKPGQKVTRGQKICAVGSTGRVTGPHLHYETILNGIPVNPMRFMAQKD